MESVAARAKTGVAVLYRRWPNKDDLALAAIRHYRQTHPVEIPDTGTLRGDMLGLLRGINDERNSFTVVASAAFAGLLSSTGLTPADVRTRIIDNRPAWSHESSAARTNAARSTWTHFPPPCCRCHST